MQNGCHTALPLPNPRPGLHKSFHHHHSSQGRKYKMIPNVDPALSVAVKTANDSGSCLTSDGFLVVSCSKITSNFSALGHVTPGLSYTPNSNSDPNSQHPPSSDAHGKSRGFLALGRGGIAIHSPPQHATLRVSLGVQRRFPISPPLSACWEPPIQPGGCPFRPLFWVTPPPLSIGQATTPDPRN